MILIAIASMGIVFGMPYLMDNSKPPLISLFTAISDLSQWILNSKPNSRSARSRLLYLVDRLRILYKTLMQQLGWLDRVAQDLRKPRKVKGLRDREGLQGDRDGLWREYR